MVSIVFSSFRLNPFFSFLFRWFAVRSHSPSESGVSSVDAPRKCHSFPQNKLPFPTATIPNRRPLAVSTNAATSRRSEERERLEPAWVLGCCCSGQFHCEWRHPHYEYAGNAPTPSPGHHHHRHHHHHRRDDYRTSGAFQPRGYIMRRTASRWPKRTRGRAGHGGNRITTLWRIGFLPLHTASIP